MVVRLLTGCNEPAQVASLEEAGRWEHGGDRAGDPVAASGGSLGLL